LPWDVTLSGNYVHQSGNAQRRTYQFTGGQQIPSITLPTEPLGSKYRLPNVALLDFAVQKAIALGGTRRATLRLNVFNALNNNTVTGRTMLSGPNFGLTTGVLLPRIAEMSVAYTF
jgi:hypothetical protein